MPSKTSKLAVALAAIMEVVVEIQTEEEEKKTATVLLLIPGGKTEEPETSRTPS